MKAIVALLAILGTAQSDITCDDCSYVIGPAFQYMLMSEDSVAEQTELMVEYICPYADNPQECDAGIRFYWPKFALAIYPVFLNADSICGQVGICKKDAYQKVMKNPTCDDCTGYIDAISKILEMEYTIMDIMEFLKGDGYCSGTTDDQCEMVVETLLPNAMLCLSIFLVEREAYLCCELTTSGICC